MDRPAQAQGGPARLRKGSPRDRIASDGRGYSEYARLMFDMIALAFQTDSTRSVSHIPPQRRRDGKAYKYLTNSRWDMHTLSHNAQEDDKIAMWRQSTHCTWRSGPISSASSRA